MSGKPLYQAGNSPLERLPNELLFRILGLLLTPNKLTSSLPRSWFLLENLPAEPNASHQTHSLLPCLLVSHRMHNVALPLFYREVKLVQKHAVAQVQHSKFLNAIDENPALAAFVRSLDITEHQNSSRPSILPRALCLLPRLRCLHVQLGELKSLSSEDKHAIFLGLAGLENLVIENTDGKTDPSCLAEGLLGLELIDQTVVSKIQSLIIRSESGHSHSWTHHHAPFVDSDVFKKVLPRFPKLRTLDLANTSINPSALFAIDLATRLRYLRTNNLQGNDTSTLAHFLSTHQAVNHSLVVFDGTGIRFGERDTRTILANLPQTLKSLNLSNSIMNASHVTDLQRLCRHLEELSVGHGLSMENAEAAILGPNFRFDTDKTSRSVDEERSSKEALEHELVLGTMRDAIAVCKLQRRLASVSPLSARTSTRRSHVRYLDLSSIDQEEQRRISNSVLLGGHSMPLECIVVSGIMVDDYRNLRKVCGGCGWRDKWVGRMVWVERR